MDKHKETFETWNKVASLYQDRFMDLDVYNHTYDHICSLITKNKAKILDIGCGPGNISKYLLSVRPDFEIFGVDFAPAMIALAKKNVPAAGFEVMDVREIGKIKTRYDGIMCGFCLPYLSATECQKLMEDCCSLLDEEGVLYISFVEGEPEESGFRTASTGDRTFFHYHRLDDLTEQLRNNSFELIKTFRVDFRRNESEVETHTILTAKKRV